MSIMARYKNYDDKDENDYNPNEAWDAWDMEREDDDNGEWVGDMYND